jgi:hypothetical protein
MENRRYRQFRREILVAAEIRNATAVGMGIEITTPARERIIIKWIY